jgi:hypothetical protein
MAKAKVRQPTQQKSHALQSKHQQANITEPVAQNK